MAKDNLFKDILKIKLTTGETRYSQGRVYLFVSVIAYFATLGVYIYKSLKPTTEIDVKVLDLIISALQYILVLFGGYVFGGKFIDVLKIIKNLKEDKKEETNTTNNTTTN